MLENGTKTGTSSLDATAVSQCSRATAIFQLYRSIWSGIKSSATKGERDSRNEQAGSKRYNTDKSRHYPQLHAAQSSQANASRRQTGCTQCLVGCRKRSVRGVSRKLKRVVSTLKDGVSLGDACRIPGSARTRISTQRNGCDSCQCNDLKRRCHTLSLFLCCSCSRFQIPSLSNVTADQTSVRHMVQYGYESSSSDEPSCRREKLPREGRNVMENMSAEFVQYKRERGND